MRLTATSKRVFNRDVCTPKIHNFPGVAGAVRPRQLKCCGIVGAGLMGGGIAMSCAEAGMKARMGDAKCDAKFALRRKRHPSLPTKTVADEGLGWDPRS